MTMNHRTLNDIARFHPFTHRKSLLAGRVSLDRVWRLLWKLWRGIYPTLCHSRPFIPQH